MLSSGFGRSMGLHFAQKRSTTVDLRSEPHGFE
jgi:hypothetical protein